LIPVLLFFPVVWACYNEMHIDKNGKSTNRHEPMNYYYNEPDKKTAKKFLAKYDLKKIPTYPSDEQSDIAVNLAYLGRYDEALYILRRLQISHPNDYNIAANLGTTYELVGKNDSALLFIKKGMQLNPDSHEGTEWVHVKILEAKLKMANNPNWINSNSVLGTGVSFSSKKSERLFQKAEDIEYQLQERIPFTPFPDALLGNVFNELGDLYATQHSVELAYIAYQFSLANDMADHFGVKKKMEQLKPILQKNNIPLPSWRAYYRNREHDQIKAEVVEGIIDQFTDKEKAKQTKGTVTTLFETLGIETPAERRKRERRRNLYIGAGIFALAVIGYVGYRIGIRKRK
jgi:tetratricopeptide (TPR) repeat protein